MSQPHAQSSRHPHNQSYRHLPVPPDEKRRPVYLHEHRRPPPRGDGLLQGFPTAESQQPGRQESSVAAAAAAAGGGQTGAAFQWPTWASFRKEEAQAGPLADGAAPRAGTRAAAAGRYSLHPAPMSRQRQPRDLVASSLSKSVPPLPSSLVNRANSAANGSKSNTPHLDYYIASQLGGGNPNRHDDVDELEEEMHGDRSVVTDYTSGTTWTAGTTTTYGGGMSVKTSTHVPKPDKAGYNRKWTDVAYKKYQMGMDFYRAQGKSK